MARNKTRKRKLYKVLLVINNAAHQEVKVILNNRKWNLAEDIVTTIRGNRSGIINPTKGVTIVVEEQISREGKDQGFVSYNDIVNYVLDLNLQEIQLKLHEQAVEKE